MTKDAAVSVAKTGDEGVLKPSSFLFNLFAGGVSGAISETILAPMERVKILLQLQALHHREPSAHSSASASSSPKNNLPLQSPPVTTTPPPLHVHQPQPAVKSPLHHNSNLHHLGSHNAHLLNNPPNNPHHYKSIQDAFYRIPREEGFLSFWRGNMTNVLRYFPTQALNFALKDWYREVLFRFNEKHSIISQKYEGIMKNFLAGGAAGATALTFVYPLDLTRTKLAADVGKTAMDREFQGLADCLRKIYTKNGVFGFYKGFGVSVSGIFVYRACYFGGYDTCKSFLNIDAATSPIFFQWLIAQLVTSASGLIAYPIDTVRRSMMMQSGKQSQTTNYRSGFHCATDIYEKHGFKGFYRGALMNLIKGSAGAIVLVLYDALHIYLQ